MVRCSFQNIVTIVNENSQERNELANFCFQCKFHITIWNGGKGFHGIIVFAPKIG